MKSSAAVTVIILLSIPGMAAAFETRDSVAYETVLRHATTNKNFLVERLGGTIVLPSADLVREGFRLPTREGWGPVDSTGAGLVPWSEIFVVSTRQSSFRKGAVAGAMIGLIGGLVFAAAMSGYDDESAGAAGVVVGVAGGALAGAVLYAPFSDWRPIYRR